MQRARLALVGTGRMGDIRAKLMYSNPSVDFISVVDMNEKKASALADKYSAQPFTSLKDAIEFSKIDLDRTKKNGNGKGLDAIVLCAPTFAHDGVIKEAADHGLSIFVEKPVDETATKITDLFNYCHDRSVALCCGFQRRFDDSYRYVAEAVRSQKIGKPYSASIFFADHPCPPIEFLLSGGDIFMDLCAHDVDYIRYALNDEVVSVFATGSSSEKVLKEAGVFDNATMVLTFSKGTVVTLTMSRHGYGYDQRCEIFGSDGLASVGHSHETTAVVADMSGFWKSALKHSFPQRFEQAFDSELKAFVDTILHGATWPITREDCVATQRVADAARQSASSGVVVHL